MTFHSILSWFICHGFHWHVLNLIINTIRCRGGAKKAPPPYGFSVSSKKIFKLTLLYIS